MLKIYSLFRVTVINVAGGKEYYFFTYKKDADWFASRLNSASVDVLNQVSLMDCDSDEERDRFLRFVKNGAVYYKETF